MRVEQVLRSEPVAAPWAQERPIYFFIYLLQEAVDTLEILQDFAFSPGLRSK